VGLGGLDAVKSSAKPIQENLFRAGEATDLGKMGSAAGQ